MFHTSNKQFYITAFVACPFLLNSFVSFCLCTLIYYNIKKISHLKQNLAISLSQLVYLEYFSTSFRNLQQIVNEYKSFVNPSLHCRKLV